MLNDGLHWCDFCLHLEISSRSNLWQIWEKKVQYRYGSSNTRLHSIVGFFMIKGPLALTHGRLTSPEIWSSYCWFCLAPDLLRRRSRTSRWRRRTSTSRAFSPPAVLFCFRKHKFAFQSRACVGRSRTLAVNWDVSLSVLWWSISKPCRCCRYTTSPVHCACKNGQIRAPRKS